MPNDFWAHHYRPTNSKDKRKTYEGYQMIQIIPKGYYVLEILLDLYDASQVNNLTKL